MQKLIQSAIAFSCMLCIHYSTQAQVPASVKQGPSGIFIFLDKDIPNGKNISSYKIERSSDNSTWKQIAQVKSPPEFVAFSKAVESARSMFPAQPIPSSEKLKELYQKALVSGNSDSLKGMRLLFPIRVALGIMYYDTSAAKHLPYRYRINAMKSTGEVAGSLVSDTVSLPFQVKFDTITYMESSYNKKSVLVKWKSAGKNPAPLFMVHKFRYGAPVVARGNVSRFAMNDTTYYVYTDTTIANESGKELQYFVSPYDQFGNAGPSSQIAVITQDNFNKGDFLRDHIAFVPKLSGVQLCWHFSDSFTVKTIEIFKSEKADAGFRKIMEVPATDTSYLDQRIMPEKTYYYYVQAVAKVGKRTKQSDIMKINVPGTGRVDKLRAPILRQVAVVNSHVRLIIEVNDSVATHVRIYRGIKNGMVALPGILEVNQSSVIAFMDTTLAAKDMKDVFYSVRNEKAGTGISSLSAELPVAMVTDIDDISYFNAFLSKGNIELYWDEAVNRKSKYVSYTLARQYGPANSKSPLMILAEGLTQSSYIDTKAQDGNQYTYTLRMIDKNGNSSEKTYKVTIPSTH